MYNDSTSVIAVSKSLEILTDFYKEEIMNIKINSISTECEAIPNIETVSMLITENLGICSKQRFLFIDYENEIIYDVYRRIIYKEGEIWK